MTTPAVPAETRPPPSCQWCPNDNSPVMCGVRREALREALAAVDESKPLGLPREEWPKGWAAAYYEIRARIARLAATETPPVEP